MRILIVGGSGTIGEAVAKELGQRHDIIIASRRHSDVTVDIMDVNSIKKMYESLGTVDAVITTTGNVHFGVLTQMTSEQYHIGLNSKLMGQVNVVLLGLDYLNEQGSFTLTSGILNRDPIRGGSSAAMVNGAVDSFVRGAAIDMPKGIRINAVSPTVLLESMSKYAAYFRGYTPVAAAQVALAYSKSVEGAQTGQVYCVG